MSEQATTLVRAVHFSCGHSYRRPDLDAAENQKIYGSSFKPRGLGHNFCLEAYFTGPVDPLTGMIVNLAEIDRWLKETIEPLDHHYLNDDVEFFKTHVPTAENIARFCYLRLVPLVASVAGVQVLKVRLHEGENLWVDFSGT